MLLDFFQNVSFDICDIFVIFEILCLIIVYMQTTPAYPENKKSTKSHFLNSRSRLSDLFGSLIFELIFKKRGRIYDRFFDHFFSGFVKDPMTVWGQVFESGGIVNTIGGR